MRRKQNYGTPETKGHGTLNLFTHTELRGDAKMRSYLADYRGQRFKAAGAPPVARELGQTQRQPRQTHYYAGGEHKKDQPGRRKCCHAPARRSRIK